MTLTASSKDGRSPFRDQTVSFAVLGVLTGGLSVATVNYPNDYFIYFTPGVVFGGLFGPLLVLQKRLPPLRAIVWLACSALAHTIATVSAVVLIGLLEDPLMQANLLGVQENLLGMQERPAMALSGVIAGTLGGGLLAGATRLLIPNTRWLTPTVVGGILGFALVLLDEPMSLGTFAFYIIWQTGYAAALARALPADK